MNPIGFCELRNKNELNTKHYSRPMLLMLSCVNPKDMLKDAVEKRIIFAFATYSMLSKGILEWRTRMVQLSPLPSPEEPHLSSISLLTFMIS